MHRGLPFRASSAVVLVAAATSSARAAPTQAENDAFRAGKKLYEDGSHAQAVQYFALAVEGPTPSIKDPVLVNQARMIRGASDMYLGRIAEADLQFERILRANPGFEPDAILFPPGVLDEFRRTREKLEKEAAEKKAGDAATKKIAALEAQNAKLVEQVEGLKTFARTERVVARRSRLIASLPFGVGQFQNGDVGLGVFFAATEGLALGAATGSFFYHASLPRDPVDANEARSAASAARVINWISLGAFVALAVGGVAQAHANFVPETYETRARPLPKGLALLRPIATPTEGGAVLGLGGAF
jgi:hypothetical protein